MTTIERLRDAAASVLARAQDVAGSDAAARGVTSVPRAALVLGEGIDLDAELVVDARIDLPDLDAAVTLGRIAGVSIASMTSAAASADTADRVRVLGLLGVGTMIVVAEGRPLADDASAHLLVVADHLNLLGDNPLRGPNLDELGPRFPDMTEAYDRTLVTAAREAATTAGIAVATGVLAAVPPPQGRTPEERVKLRSLGADWVGGGVVPEAIVTRHMGLRVVGLVEREGSGGRSVAPVLRRLLPRLEG